MIRIAITAAAYFHANLVYDAQGRASAVGPSSATSASRRPS
jgi:hypothetical protein